MFDYEMACLTDHVLILSACLPLSSAHQMALKWADIGHLASPNEVHLRWVYLLEEEMFRQGDRERANGLLISPLMNRLKGPGITKSQTGVRHSIRGYGGHGITKSQTGVRHACSPTGEKGAELSGLGCNQGRGHTWSLN